MSKEPTLREGGKVYLLRQNIRIKQLYEKLDFRKYRPFKIKEKLSDLVYRVKLPTGTRKHLVFYISLLELTPPNIPLQSVIE